MNLVTCDGCGRDLSGTSFDARRIKVELEQIPHEGSVVLDTYILQPLSKRIYHFCSAKCLNKYQFEQGK